MPLSEEGVTEDAQPVVLTTGLSVQRQDRHSIGSNKFFGVGQTGCYVAACHDVVAVLASLQELSVGSGVLSQCESVQYQGKVVLAGEAEIQPKHHFQQCRCGKCWGPQGEVRGGLVQGLLQDQQLLLL